MSDQLESALLNVLELPLPSVEQVAVLLQSGMLGIPASRPAVERRVNGGSDVVERVVRLTQAWAESGADASSLGAILTASVRRVESATDSGPSVELVWSGPDGGAGGVRSTLPVMTELVGLASKHLIIVGYSLFLSGEEMQGLLAQIADRRSEGVDVWFIVDGDYAGYEGSSPGHSIEEIKRHWPRGKPRPRIDKWTSSGKSAKLHAKVVVADDRDVLVTSANLTGAAVAQNLEVGLRVRGEPAKRCAEHFQALAADGVFESVEWD